MAVMIKGSNTQSNVFCESETQISNYSITAVIEQIFLDIKENEVWGDFLNCRILIDNSKETDVCLIDLKDYDLKTAAYLTNQKVTVEKRKKGFKLRPLKFQPEETIEYLDSLKVEDCLDEGNEEKKGTSLDETLEVRDDKPMKNHNVSQSQQLVENLVISLAEQSQRLGLPMAIAVSIPNMQKRN